MNVATSKFLRSLPIKFTGVLFLLFLLVALIQGALVQRALESGSQESNQREATRLLSALAEEISTYTAPLNKERVFLLLARFYREHPIYLPVLLGAKGEILVAPIGDTFFHAKSIAPSDLEKGIIKSGNDSFPFTIQDPRSPGNERPFAVSKIEMDGVDGYLVILVDSLFDDHGGFWAQFASTRRNLTSLILLSLVVSLLLGAFVSFGLTKRLRELTAAVNAFRSNRDTSMPESTSLDEVGDLTRAIVEMKGEIGSYISRLVERDILRRDIVTGISHDLRTPLTSIRGYARTLKERLERKQLIDEGGFAAVIERNAEHLSSLVEGLFELAQLDDVIEKKTPKSFLVRDLLEQLKSSFEVIAQKKMCEIVVRTDGDGQFYADPKLLQRALANLVDNAIRYTHPETQVEIVSSFAPSALEISVSDSGPGIPVSDLPNIFEKFYRADQVRGKADGGTGIGLAVVKRIIEGHGGSIRVESTVGVGTKFVVTLPIAPPDSLRDDRMRLTPA